MESPFRRHCRDQANLQGCHNDIQKGLHRETSERIEDLTERGESLGRRAARRIAR